MANASTERSGGRAAAQDAAGGWAPRVVEILLVAVLALITVEFAWPLIAPSPVGEAGPSAVPRQANDTSGIDVLTRFDPFSRRPASAATPSAATTETTLDLALHSVQATDSGDGYAIIRTPDGKQAPYAVGDEIISGVRLERLDPAGRAILLRGGVRESLSLADRIGAATPASAAAANDGAVGDERLFRSFMDAIQFTPRGEGARLVIELQPRSGGEGRFAAFGFQPGDVIERVNGVAVGERADVLREQIADLSGAPRIQLEVNRGGETIPITIDLANEG